MTTTFSKARAPHASKSGMPIFVDTSALSRLTHDFAKAPLSVRKAVYKSVRAVAQVVADDAKMRASFSSRIPETIKVRGSGFRLKVVAGGEGAPDAAPLENNGNPGKFRHPVFEVSGANGGGGRWHGKRRNAPKAGLSRRGGIAPWVDQQAMPFLAPALDAHREEVVRVLTDAVHDAVVLAIKGS
jgi:hypothetical protein